MNKSGHVVVILCAIVVAVVLAIFLHAYLQRNATISSIKNAVEALKEDNAANIDKISGKLKEDDIESWFEELTTVFETTNDEKQKRGIMKVLGKKANLMLGAKYDRVIEILEKTFDDKDDLTAVTAIEVITRDYRYKDCVEKLRLEIKDGNSRMRVKMAALEGLGRISEQIEDIKLLEGYLNNKRAVLRMAAVEGLAEVRTVNALRILHNRLVDKLDGAPAEKNLLVRISILLKIGPIAAELKNENTDLFKAIEESLETSLKDTRMLTLYMNYAETTSHENVAEMKRYLDIDLIKMKSLDKNRLEKGIFFATLVALYHIGAGDRYTITLDRMQSVNIAPQDQAILEDALSSYFEFLLAPGGADMPLNDIDRSRLLFVCRRLATLIGEEKAINEFAQSNLVTLTGQHNISSKESWEKYLGKFNTTDKKFTPASGVKPE